MFMHVCVCVCILTHTHTHCIYDVTGKDLELN